MVSFADNEIIVGLAAKQGRTRNINNTIKNNKLFMAGLGTEEDAAPVTLLRSGSHDGGGGGNNVAYEVDFRDKAFHVTPPRILEHIYKYMHDIAASHCTNVDESNTVITVPLGFTEDQRRAVSACAAAAGFRVVQVSQELTFRNFSLGFLRQNLHSVQYQKFVKVVPVS
jgi:molecular chaperone DnaK (HSP70)